MTPVYICPIPQRVCERGLSVLVIVIWQIAFSAESPQLQSAA
jgi:hypothetical protein